MKTKEAKELGKHIAALLQTRQTAQAYALLFPVLNERNRFSMLERIGEPIGAGPPETVNTFLERIAADRTEGGWVVIGSALRAQLDHDLVGSLARCRNFIIAGDVWYATDILAERVPGPALVAHFQPTLTLLTPWREDANPWVRRAVGVSVHFWAKRSRGAEDCVPQAETLLAFLKPMFEEWDLKAVKGLGWGFKTLGKHYADLVADWLAQQVVPARRRHRALMLRKALTFLSDEQRARATGDISS